MLEANTTIKIFEVGPRDGLQNEPVAIPTEAKIRLIDSLSDSGLSHIEITSFVNPKWVPQLADAAEVCKGIRRKPGVEYSALVPNEKGYGGALASGMKTVAVFLSASESHNKKNVNKSIADTISAFEPVFIRAKQDGIKVRAYISTVVGCPYEGKIKPQAVASIARRLFDLGTHEISLGDTIGAAGPQDIRELMRHLYSNVNRRDYALHLHNTRGMALVNIFAGLEENVRVFDSSIGGIGGCPYAPGATGNVPTEEVVWMFENLGFNTGINLDKLLETGQFLKSALNRELPGLLSRAGIPKPLGKTGI